MKNIITAILILVLPIAVYCAMKNDTISQSSVAQPTKPQVIKFASPMCSSCKKISKELAELKQIYENDVEFIDINVTKPSKQTDELIRQYKITGVPVTIFIDNKLGKEKRIVGETSRQTLEQHIKELIHE